MSNDDEADDEAEGLSYYDLRISGLENELRKVAGKDKDLYCVWPDEEDVSGTKKNSSSKSAKKSNVKKKKHDVYNNKLMHIIVQLINHYYIFQTML